jgi:hypothetical protein
MEGVSGNHGNSTRELGDLFFLIYECNEQDYGNILSHLHSISFFSHCFRVSIMGKKRILHGSDLGGMS